MFLPLGFTPSRARSDSKAASSLQYLPVLGAYRFGSSPQRCYRDIGASPKPRVNSHGSNCPRNRITGQDGAYLSRLLLDKGYRVFGAFPERRLAQSVAA